MKVMHIINSMIVGGAERLLKDSIMELSESHPDVQQYLVTLYGGGPTLTEIKPYIHHIDLNLKKNNFLITVLTLRRFISVNTIDIIHTHLYDSMLLGRLIANRKISYFNTYHTGFHNPTSTDYSYKRHILDKLTFKKRFHTIYVSNSVKEDIKLGVDITQNEHIIPNFPSKKFSQKYYYKPNPALRLISVGTFKKQKNHFFSIEVMKKLRGYDIILDIYGYGELEEKLKTLVKESKCKINIKTGEIIRSELLAQYDLFFMASFEEGMSIALLESMATGLPSLLSNISSFRETAKDAAFYFDLKSPESAAETLIHLYNNKPLLKKLSEKAITYSGDFTIDNYISKLVGLYNSATQ